MSRKNRNRQNDRAAAPPEERGMESDSPSAGRPPPDQVSEAVNPGSGSHKTQKHKEKRFGHN
ncbi:hypothetical protein [Streptomyces sp. CMB-StM0423]|uniref:hypothetical protein n=1 Tax=Streptomyces sp. CMB-StM0423 TaxID=2059884 RepID=UPI000C70EB35|nr:hypothetical protein [Streptomyces sp. CMB-StM0423]AUH43529.1 hypothetical protein CXR04_28165 [Streptomyces sp. CMB-StM0423]